MTLQATKNAITNADLQGKVEFILDVPVKGEYFKYYIHPGGDVAEIGRSQYKQTVDSSAYESYIVELFSDIDEIIDLDFARQFDYNGTTIDIYAVADDGTSIVGGTYFRDGWFDIDYEITGDYVFDQNTIVHEIGHALGLDHPLGNGYEPGYTVDDTVMSYNIGSAGWNNAFTEADIEVLKRIWGSENDAQPTDITVANSSVYENIPDGSLVAMLATIDQDPGDIHAYALVSGDGDFDNSVFTIEGDQLKIIEKPDFEVKSSYSIRLQTRDSGGQTFEKEVAIHVNDINEVPAGLSVSASTFSENIASGSAVATLSTSDPDSGDTHTYSLVSGVGDADNSAFTIEGDQLKIFESSDFETKSSYSIRLQTKDSGGLALEKEVTLNVSDVNEVPADVSMSAFTFDENIAGGSAVATLSTSDPDSGDTHTYALVSGDGDADNSAFAIEGDQLRIVELPDYETQDSYSIRVQSKDADGLSLEKSFHLTVKDLDEDVVLTQALAKLLVEQQGLNIVIPSTYTSIANSAFHGHIYGKQLKSVEIPNSVISIGHEAFKGHSLSRIVIPDSVVSIGDRAFSSNYELESIEIGNNVESIGDYAFKKAGNLVTGLEHHISIPDSVKTMGEGAFYAIYNLESVDIGSGLTSIPDFAFAHSHGLKEIEIPSSIEAIGYAAFHNTALTEVRIPKSVKTIDDDAFNPDVKIYYEEGNGAPLDLDISASSFDENIAELSVVATLASDDPDFGDTHTYALVSGDGDADNSAFAIEGDQLKIIESPDFEAKSSYSIRLQTKDSGGLTLEKSFDLNVNDLEVNIGVQSDLSGRQGGLVSIPIQINDASGVEAIDLNIAYDQAIFDVPASTIFEPGELNPEWSFVTNASVPGIVSLSSFGQAELGSEYGSIAVLNLQVKDYAEIGKSKIDLVDVEINESQIASTVTNGEILVEKPSFQVKNVESHSHGLSLQLNDTADMDVFRLYSGKNAGNQESSLNLANSSNEVVNLSAHWQDDTKQLHLLSNQILEDGDYTLKIRADGLVSQSGELLDGNGDGEHGDDYEYSFTHVIPDHFVSVSDTARSAGQDLSVNGKDLKDGITGIPIHLSTTSSLQSVSGEISFNSDLLKDVSLTKGSDLPSDWVVNYAQSSPGTLAFTISGQSVAMGSIQDTLRLIGQVDANASDSYGSTSLIQATITDSSAGQISFKSDPGLMVNAYSGDTTGNGSHSSLDASRVQRVVVGLDSGFDAFDDINPVLIGDTTGNGSLSSLDASRIQQEVVGLPVDEFPSIPGV